MLKEEEEESLECPICFEDLQMKDIFTLHCNHIMCRDCTLKIMSHATKASPTCPLCRAKMFSRSKNGTFKKPVTGIYDKNKRQPSDREECFIQHIYRSTTMKEGDLYFLVSNTWMKAWNKYRRQFIYDEIGAGGILKYDRPGPIDNFDLLDLSKIDKCSTLSLRQNLRQGKHYEVVPKDIWDNIYYW